MMLPPLLLWPKRHGFAGILEGLAGGINLYAYGRNEPVRHIDPMGLQDFDAVAFFTEFFARPAGVAAFLAINSMDITAVSVLSTSAAAIEVGSVLSIANTGLQSVYTVGPLALWILEGALGVNSPTSNNNLNNNMSRTINVKLGPASANLLTTAVSLGLQKVYIAYQTGGHIITSSVLRAPLTLASTPGWQIPGGYAFSGGVRLFSLQTAVASYAAARFGWFFGSYIQENWLPESARNAIRSRHRALAAAGSLAQLPDRF
jgi:hypothetical protein